MRQFDMKRILISVCMTCTLAPLNVTAEELPKDIQSLLSASHSINSRSAQKSEDEKALELRFQAVSTEAYSWGVQMGAHHRMKEIQQILKAESFNLNKVFNFSKFIVDGQMLMPSALEAERIYVKNGRKEARSVNMSYTLDSPPRIVTQIPTWRNYLVRTIEYPEAPIKHAHPKNSAEIKVWDSEFKRGFAKGVVNANGIFESDLNRLHFDIAGLYQYRYLLAQNIVTLPVLTRNETPVLLLDSGKTINLKDVKYRITLDSTFKKVDEWQPVFIREYSNDR